MCSTTTATAATTTTTSTTTTTTTAAAAAAAIAAAASKGTAISHQCVEINRYGNTQEENGWCVKSYALIRIRTSSSTSDINKFIRYPPFGLARTDADTRADRQIDRTYMNCVRANISS